MNEVTVKKNEDGTYTADEIVDGQKASENPQNRLMKVLMDKFNETIVAEQLSTETRMSAVVAFAVNYLINEELKHKCSTCGQHPPLLLVFFQSVGQRFTDGMALIHGAQNPVPPEKQN